MILQDISNVTSIKDAFIYLISPYSGNEDDEEYRYEAAKKYIETIYTLTGHIIFSPIVYGHHLKSKVGNKFIDWQPMCLHVLSGATLAVVLPLEGLEQSKGCQAEIAFCKEYGIPVVCEDEAIAANL